MPAFSPSSHSSADWQKFHSHLKAILKAGGAKQPDPLASRLCDELQAKLTASDWAARLHDASAEPAEFAEKAAENRPQALAPRELAHLIDHTLLKPDITREQVRTLCREAAQYQFAAVCIPPNYVALARKALASSAVKTVTVIGFPLGYNTSEVKAFETRQAIETGAQEIDMVLNVGAMKNTDYATVLEDIAQVVQAAQSLPVKVILETSLLNSEEKILATLFSRTAGASFVKTSTGFAQGGAKIEDIRMMRALVGPGMGVKASGGVRTYEDAVNMVRAGANRIGASSSVAIVTGAETQNTGNY